jgi:hypothetical protein
MTFTNTGSVLFFALTVKDFPPHNNDIKKILATGGKYMTHCNGINAEAAIQLYESLLKSLGVPLEFTQTRAYVPSFQVSISRVQS